MWPSRSSVCRFDLEVQRYTRCLYWATLTAASTGYGDMFPHNQAEKWLSEVSNASHVAQNLIEETSVKFWSTWLRQLLTRFQVFWPVCLRKYIIKLFFFILSPSQQPPTQLQTISGEDQPNTLDTRRTSKCLLNPEGFQFHGSPGCYGRYLCGSAPPTFEWSDAEISMKNQLHAHCENCFSAQCTTNTAEECALVSCTACKVKMHGCKMDDHWTICTKRLRDCVNKELGCTAILDRIQMVNHIRWSACHQWISSNS